MSSVWHRMLPIDNDNYLEIVTVFTHKQKNWEHYNEDNVQSQFLTQLEDSGLSFVLW